MEEKQERMEERDRSGCHILAIRLGSHFSHTRCPGPQDLEEELARLKAAIARFLGIHPSEVTPERINAMPPLGSHNHLSEEEKEMLERLKDPAVARALQEANQTCVFIACRQTWRSTRLPLHSRCSPSSSPHFSPPSFLNSLYMPPPVSVSRREGSGMDGGEMPTSYASDHASGGQRSSSRTPTSARLGRTGASSGRPQTGRSSADPRYMDSGRSTPAVSGYPKICVSLYDHEPSEVRARVLGACGLASF